MLWKQYEFGTDCCFQAVKYLQLMVVQAKKQQKAQNDCEKPISKKISIDPKTWVKLGHFHLLLEEYRKGRWFWSQTCSYEQYLLFVYSVIRVPNVLQNPGREPLDGSYISLWTGIGLLSFQRLSVVSTVAVASLQHLRSLIKAN